MRLLIFALLLSACSVREGDYAVERAHAEAKGFCKIAPVKKTSVTVTYEKPECEGRVE